MRIKKLLAIILIAVLTLSQTVVLAAAETASTSIEVGVEAATATPISSSPTLLVNKGDTVTVRLNINKNDGIFYFKTKLNYDANLFTVTGVTKAEIPNLPITADIKDNTVLFTAANYGTLENVTYTGEFAVITLTAKENCSGDDAYVFSLELFQNNPHNCMSADENNVALLTNTVKVFVHNFAESGVVTAPTCTEKGYTTFKCADCGKEIKNEWVNANGHSPLDAVEENRIETTCTETGGYDSVVYCSVCGDELSRTNMTIDALGHDLVHHDAVAATCTTDGNKEYDTCTRCDYTTFEKTDALGHTPGDAVKENEVAATVKSEGSYDSVVYCTVCKEELSREKVTVKKLPETKIEVKENGHMKFLADKGILIIDGSVTIESLMKNSNATNIVTADGKAPEKDTLKTGMKLLLFVGDEQTDSVSLALLGDIDGDGDVAVSDARLALRKAVGLDELDQCRFHAADVDFINEVSVADARTILRIAVQLETGTDLIAKASKEAK